MNEFLLNDLNLLEKELKVALYGAGASGKFVFKKLSELRPDLELTCFIDDVKTGAVEDIPIMSLTDVSKDTLILVTTSYWREVVDKLESLSFNYYVVDLLSGKTTQDFIRREFSGKEIKFFTPNNYLLQVSGNFERIEECTIDWINSFNSESCFYDVGASSGIYGIYGAVIKGCKTVAIEPDAQNFAILEMNHHLNRENLYHDFISLNLGLGSKASLMPLKCQEYLAGAHGKVFDFKNRIPQNEMKYDHIQYLLVDSLDYLIDRYQLPIPNYLKIDVDGAEIEVIKGCQETLRLPEFKELMVETDLDTFSELNTILISMGFKLKEKFNIEEIIGGEIQGVHNYLYNKTN
jgi:FkbM family methyltransferase